MNIKNLKDIVCFAIVVCLSLFHVHCSIMSRLKQGAKATEILKTLYRIFAEKSYICNTP